MNALAVSVTVLVGYLVGAIPVGYLVARWRGVNIFAQGSGNPGATNVGRVLGRRFGLLVFALDFAKGALPVAAAGGLARLAGPSPTIAATDGLGVAAGLAAVLGHMFPVYLGFRGGKGVATGAGVVAVLLPGPALGALLTWVAVVGAARYVSLASVAAAAALCGFRLGLHPEPWGPAQRLVTGFCFVAAGLVVVRHRANLARLVHGTENRLQDSPTMLLFTKTVHVLALGLWFGSAVFFTFVAAPLLFQTFEALGTTPPEQRPAWLPVSASFDKEQGTRLAGAAVGPLFPWYFLFQGVCGLLAVTTALGWSRAQPGNTVHRIRTLLLILALLTVVAGWPLVEKVSELRSARYDPDPAVAAQARSDFGRWHLYSLLLNFVTLALAGGALALAAQLPTTTSSNAERGLRHGE
jgi:acyl-phosphate glycerol 3-phosphate acyltransferase